MSATIEAMKEELEKERAYKDQLLNEKPQVLNIDHRKEHFYEIFSDDLYLLMTFKDDSVEHYYEELYRFRKGEERELLYNGKEIQFDLDVTSGHISILDGADFHLSDDRLGILYSEELNLNEPLLDMTPQLRHENTFPGRSYILMKKLMDDTTEKLLSIHMIDYASSDSVISSVFYFDTADYLFTNDYASLIYQEQNDKGYFLYRLSFNTGEKAEISFNPTEDFQLEKIAGVISYYSEKSGVFEILKQR